MCVLVAQSFPILCNTMDCSLAGSSVHGILQARILEWVAISFSRGSSWPRDWTQVSCLGRWILYHWATREAQTWLSNAVRQPRSQKLTCPQIQGNLAHLPSYPGVSVIIVGFHLPNLLNLQFFTVFSNWWCKISEYTKLDSLRKKQAH